MHHQRSLAFAGSGEGAGAIGRWERGDFFLAVAVDHFFCVGKISNYVYI